MMKEARVISIDLGATMGKVGVLSLVEERLHFQVLHRFPTRGSVLPTAGRDLLVWNVLRFLEEIATVLQGERHYLSVGVDSWGVDYALLDAQGRLLSFPVHYRDRRTEGVMERMLEVVGKTELFRATGIYPMPINTLFQLYSMVLEDDPHLMLAHTFLMIPDLFNYWLSGERACEYTIATTSQCYSVPKKAWAMDLLEALSIPTKIFPEVVPPGTVLGECRFGGQVVATTCHDTASAVAAVPFAGPGIYISSGTWSLVGVETQEPILTERAMEWGFTNEGGYGAIRFLKNATGMWLLEECNREWGLSYEEIIARAMAVPAFPGFIDPDDPRFLPPGGMSARIQEYLRETGQCPPADVGPMARLIFESLVLNYRWIIEGLESITGKQYETVHVVGGGARNEFVNQLIADATAKEVVAGPYEATSIGNGLIQLIALGLISDLREGRQLVRASFAPKRFVPQARTGWDEAYAEWREITGKEAV